MINRILWTIDNELNGKTFERLAVDLLYRNGYKDIVPVEPQDAGRDAEELPRAGRGRAGEQCFFQFSLEASWKGKIRRDGRKLHRAGFSFVQFVFVTSRKARGVDVDELRKEFRNQYGWDLVVYSREWLRLQLEEAHPDLAQKYLGVEVPDWSSYLKNRVLFNRPAEKHLLAAWDAFQAGRYDFSTAKLKQFLEEQPESVSTWQVLAWSQYQSFQYDEALTSINRAIRLVSDDAQSLSIRACILTEKGIRERNRAALLEGRKSFEHMLRSTEKPDWSLLYNLGNVLSALGQHSEAIEYYKRALKIQVREPSILKNLASSYHMVGDHKSEMKCINQVLELDPDRPEGLVTKAVSLLVDFNEAEEAAALLERAIKIREDWAIRWPHIWYWLAEACYQDKQLKRALKWIEEGLAHQPGHLGLQRLKSNVFSKLIATEPTLIEEARHYWNMRLQEQDLDYESRKRLILLEQQEQNAARAWELLEECFEVMELEPVVPLRNVGLSIDECVIALRFLPNYWHFRKAYPVSDYWEVDDPLYDLPFPPPKTAKIEAALLTYFAVPFGIGLQTLEQVGEDRKFDRSLRELFEEIRVRLEKASVEAARYLASGIPKKANGIDLVVEKLTDALLFIGFVALREFGRQRGWISAQFGVSIAAVNGASIDYDENLIHTNVISKSLITLNEEVELLPKNNIKRSRD